MSTSFPTTSDLRLLSSRSDAASHRCLAYRVVRWGTAKAPSGAKSISFRGHAARELFGPVERHLDLKRRAGRLQHQEVLAIGHHGKT
jgi:hypothetical protein